MFVLMDLRSNGLLFECIENGDVSMPFRNTMCIFFMRHELFFFLHVVNQTKTSGSKTCL